MNTQHLVSVTFETCFISVWMRGHASEQLWKDGWCSSRERCLSADSSGSMWSILTGAIAVIMVCSWHFLVGIYWYNSLKRSLCEHAPSLHWNVSQAGNTTSPASLDPSAARESRRWCSQQSWWHLTEKHSLVLRKRKWSDFQLQYLFWDTTRGVETKRQLKKNQALNIHEYI